MLDRAQARNALSFFGIYAVRMRTSLIVALLLSACDPDVGTADQDAALEVVYDPDGVPAFAGQALAIQSCGAGGFCHSDDIEPADRFGAPNGLGLDVRVASTTVEIEEEATARLLAHQTRMFGLRGLVWEQVGALRMPPGGAAGDEYRAAVENITFERFDSAGEPLGPLPRIETEEGREIFRNWLASGVPVVERTQRRIDRQPNEAGYTVPVCERGCVDPTWASIYVQIIAPSCARSRCHDSSDPASDLDLYADLSVPAPQTVLTPEQLAERITPVLERIRGADAEGSQCRREGHVILTPSDPDTSLIYLKVAAASGDDVCGGKMPLSGNPLTEQRLCAIREWIACGACAPGDSSCDACTEAARATCGVAASFDPAEGTAQCAVQQPCMNRPP